VRNVDKYKRSGPAEISKAYAFERRNEFVPPSERVGKSEKFVSSTAKARLN